MLGRDRGSHHLEVQWERKGTQGGPVEKGGRAEGDGLGHEPEQSPLLSALEQLASVLGQPQGGPRCPFRAHGGVEHRWAQISVFLAEVGDLTVHGLSKRHLAGAPGTLVLWRSSRASIPGSWTLETGTCTFSCPPRRLCGSGGPAPSGPLQPKLQH